MVENAVIKNRLERCIYQDVYKRQGYSKVLARLCNKAGISAHIVLGNWKYSGSYTLVKVDFAGKQVYICLLYTSRCV